MDFLDKAKDLAEQHSDKIGEGLDKAADLINEKTGGKFEGQIEGAIDQAKGFLGGGDQQAEEAPQA